MLLVDFHYAVGRVDGSSELLMLCFVPVVGGLKRDSMFVFLLMFKHIN